jgi:hypothetical protein
VTNPQFPEEEEKKSLEVGGLALFRADDDTQFDDRIAMMSDRLPRASSSFLLL